MQNNAEMAKKLRDIADAIASQDDVARYEKERQEALRRLAELKKKVDGIRDYSYRMIPNFFLTKAEELMKEGIKKSPEIVLINIVDEMIENYLKS